MNGKVADYVVESVNSIAEVIPEIWGGCRVDDDNQKKISRTNSELDALLSATAAVGA